MLPGEVVCARVCSYTHVYVCACVHTRCSGCSSLLCVVAPWLVHACTVALPLAAQAAACDGCTWYVAAVPGKQQFTVSGDFSTKCVLPLMGKGERGRGNGGGSGSAPFD